MDKEKLALKARGITRSRKGNEFNFDSPAPGIHIYHNTFPGGMDLMRRLEAEGKFQREDYYDEEIGKKASTTWIYQSDEIADAFEEIVDSYCQMWDIAPITREAFRITKFEHNEFFSMHPDDSYGTPRTVSMVYYPNDDYEGGELEFVHFGVKIKPKAGDFLLFPSAYSYQHQIHKVTAGNTRYTMVCFGCEITEEERSARLDSIDFPYEPEFKYFLRQ